MYDTSYVSHAHGWSSGPTSALTEFVLGLSITSPVGKTWKLSPQFGDLKSAEGGFVTRLGKFRAAWKLSGTGYMVDYQVPEGTMGVMVLPVGKMARVLVDGMVMMRGKDLEVWDGEMVLKTSGGKHRVVVG